MPLSSLAIPDADHLRSAVWHSLSGVLLADCRDAVAVLFGETDGDGLELLVLLGRGDLGVGAAVGAGELDVVGERRQQGAG